MNRGDIYWCDFEPATGAEVKKLRPAIIISNPFKNQIYLTNTLTFILKLMSIIVSPKNIFLIQVVT